MFGDGKVRCRSGVKATDGDVIPLELDADARMLTFRKNDSETIGTVEGIERGEYCIAVTVYRKGDSVSFI